MKEEEVGAAPICELLDRKRKLKDLVPELQGTELPEFKPKVDLTNNWISEVVKTEEEAVNGSDSEQSKTKRPYLEGKSRSLAGQMKQPLSLMQQPNPTQQVIEKSSTLLPQRNMILLINQQKQIFQSRRASMTLDSIDGNADEGDWQEEAYQKIKSMKEIYFLELLEMYQKISYKLQLHESLAEQLNDKQLERFRTCSIMLERLISFLQLSKSQILPTSKNMVTVYEKQLIQVINSNRCGEYLSLIQPAPGLPLSQVNQQQNPHENHVNPHIPSMNLLNPMLTMQQNSMTNLQPNSLPVFGVPNLQHDSLLQTSPRATLLGENVIDFQEEVYQKIKFIKDMYFVELSKMHQKISDKIQQHESLAQQPDNKQLEKLKTFKVMLERLMSFLQLSRCQISPTVKDKVVLYEKQIIQVINIKRFRKPDSLMQPNSMHPLSGVLNLHHNSLVQVSPQPGFVRKNIRDIQEEIYQKINSMKEVYFAELSKMHQKISDKLQQCESISQQPNNELLDKFKTFKIMLERMISFLQLSRSKISPTLEDKVVLYEKQIIQVINSNRRGKHPSLIH